MGQAGLKRMKRFTPAVVVPQLEDVYRRLTATRTVDEGPRPATQTAEGEGGS
jgi:hypothetical protein